MKQNFSRLVSPFRSHLMACVLFALFSIAVANGQVVVTGGSFEGGTLGIGGMDITNWTLSGSPDLQSAAVNDRSAEANPSPDGGNWVWMGGESVSTTAVTGLLPDTTYLLSFYAAVQPRVNNWGADITSGSLNVSVFETFPSSTSLLSTSVTATDTNIADNQFVWQLFELEFTTTAANTPGQTNFSFRNTSIEGIVLDGVQIAVLPEPSTGLLAILGAVTLLMRRRRHFSC